MGTLNISTPLPSKCSPTPSAPSLCCLCSKKPPCHQQKEAINPQILRPLKQIFLWRRTSLVPKTWTRNHSSGLSLLAIQNLSHPLFPSAILLEYLLLKQCGLSFGHVPRRCCISQKGCREGLIIPLLLRRLLPTATSYDFCCFPTSHSAPESRHCST